MSNELSAIDQIRVLQIKLLGVNGELAEARRDLLRLVEQAQAVSHLLQGVTGIGPCSIPEGVQLVVTRLAKTEAERDKAWEVVAAARDVLVAFQKQAGVTPGQDGYSATMTEAEMQLARAVAEIDRLLKGDT